LQRENGSNICGCGLGVNGKGEGDGQGEDIHRQAASFVRLLARQLDMPRVYFYFYCNSNPVGPLEEKSLKDSTC